MWLTTISIDEVYNAKECIIHYLDEIGVYYQYDNIGSRDIFSIENMRGLSLKIREIVAQIILVDMKYRYFVKYGVEIGDIGINALLVGEMLFFDSGYEHNRVLEMINSSGDISIDGIFNFKMCDIKENWDYLIELYTKVPDVDDKLILAKYLHENAVKAGKRVYLVYKDDRSYLFDMASMKRLDRVNIGDNSYIADMMSIIASHSGILYIEKKYKFSPFIDVMRNVIHIEFV